MQYMMLIHNDEKLMAAMSDETRVELVKQFGAYTESLKSSGQWLAGDRLFPNSAARTIRSKDGKPVVTDGPFAEVKEALGGYYIVEAKDIDEAVAIASRVPSIAAGFGGVEVRPIMPMPRN
ncbi:MAG: YciI family protein [Acidobacteriota bacterium]